MGDSLVPQALLNFSDTNLALDSALFILLFEAHHAKSSSGMIWNLTARTPERSNSLSAETAMASHRENEFSRRSGSAASAFTVAHVSSLYQVMPTSIVWLRFFTFRRFVGLRIRCVPSVWQRRSWYFLLEQSVHSRVKFEHVQRLSQVVGKACRPSARYVIRHRVGCHRDNRSCMQSVIGFQCI